MPIQYKIDVLHSLKDAGYNSSRLRQDKLMGQQAIQKLRKKQLVSWTTIETICRLLDCQPGDVLEYVSHTITTKRTQTNIQDEV